MKNERQQQQQQQPVLFKWHILDLYCKNSMSNLRVSTRARACVCAFSPDRFATTKSKQYNAGVAKCASEKKREREWVKEEAKGGQANFNTVLVNTEYAEMSSMKKTTMQFVVRYVFYHISTLASFHCQPVSQLASLKPNVIFWVNIVTLCCCCCCCCFCLSSFIPFHLRGALVFSLCMCVSMCVLALITL